MRNFLVLIILSLGFLPSPAFATILGGAGANTLIETKASTGVVPEGSPVSNWLKAYEGFDLERFIEFYAVDTKFTDPTAQLDFSSRQQLKEAYSIFMQGRYGGNFEFDVKRMVTEGSVTVIEGLFSLTWNGKKGTIQFTTWLDFEDGKIIRQLDIFDYNSLQRQIPEYGQGEPSEYTPG